MEAAAPMFKWYRSRYTGRYFIFGLAWVERVNTIHWRAAFSSGKRKGKTRDGFTSMSRARGWIEKLLNKDNDKAKVGEPGDESMSQECQKEPDCSECCWNAPSCMTCEMEDANA